MMAHVNEYIHDYMMHETKGIAMTYKDPQLLDLDYCMSVQTTAIQMYHSLLVALLSMDPTNYFSPIWQYGCLKIHKFIWIPCI